MHNKKRGISEMSNSKADESKLYIALGGTVAGAMIVILLDWLISAKTLSSPSSHMLYRVGSSFIVPAFTMLFWKHRQDDGRPSDDDEGYLILLMLVIPYFANRLSWAVYLKHAMYIWYDAYIVEAFALVPEFVKSSASSFEYYFELFAAYALALLLFYDIFKDKIIGRRGR